MNNEKRYLEALRHIVCLLEPLGWECPGDTCEGCRFEAEEALRSAMNVLAGLEIDAHWGPMHTREEFRGHDKESCKKCIDHHPTKDEIEAAYAAVGFMKDGKLWRRGNAF